MVSINELVVGIAVDDVHDVIYIDPANINEAPSASDPISKKYLKGTTTYNDKIITILDLAKILMREDLIVNQEM